MKKSIINFRKFNNIIRSQLTSFGIVLCLLGLVGLLPSTYYWYHGRQIAQAAVKTDIPNISHPTVINDPQTITGKPNKLTIPSLNLNLQVADGVQNTQSGQWTLSNDKAHYALVTVQPNNTSGNTLIYGHYRQGVFATLRKIQPGSFVTVQTENSYTFTYRFTESKIVDPSDGSIFGYQGAPKLTLQTCTGAFMQNRQMFSFEFVSVQKTN